jgi:hypothetical protein
MDNKQTTSRRLISLFVLGLSAMAVGCSPIVKVEAPDKPIVINLNIKLDADLRLKIENKADDDVDNNPIF